MEISTYQHIENDFGTVPFYSRNYVVELRGTNVGGTGKALLDFSEQGATGYLINGMYLSSNKVGSARISINTHILYLSYQVLAPTFMQMWIPQLFFCHNRKVLIDCGDTNLVASITFQFLMPMKKIKK